MSIMTFGKNTLLGAAAVAISTAFVPAQAFEPIKPIDFVIMAGKGGGADKMARLMQSIVEKEAFRRARWFRPTNPAERAPRHWSI